MSKAKKILYTFAPTFKNDHEDPLSKAPKEVTTIATALLSAGYDDHRSIDSEITLEKLLERLANGIMKRAEIDYVVIYISSHGSFETKDDDFAGGAFAKETTEVSLYKKKETFTIQALADKLCDAIKEACTKTKLPIQFLKRNVCLILDACQSGVANILSSDSLPTSVFMRIASSQSDENARELVFAETFGKFVKNHGESWEADADEIDTFMEMFSGKKQMPDIIIPSCTGTSNIMWRFFGKPGSKYSSDIGKMANRMSLKRYGANAGVPAPAAPPAAPPAAAAPADTLDVAAAAATASVKAAAAVAAAEAAAKAAAAAAAASAAAAVAAADASAAAKAASVAAMAAADAAAIASTAIAAAVAANAVDST